MPPPNLTEGQFYDHVHQLLRAHESLLADGRRNLPFYRALKKHVRPDTQVLDIGSGTGIWAVAAARFGAGRVVAIESEPLLIEIIRELARANGVADRIEAIHGDSRALSLPREFDVVITETIGHVGFDEQIVPIAIDAQAHFLKPDGVLIPGTISLCAAAVQFKKRPERLPAEIPLDYAYFESLAYHAPLPVVMSARFKRVTPPRTLIRTDLTTIAAPPDLTNMTVRWSASEVSAAVDGFVIWCESTLTKGVRLSTLQTTSWSPIIYRIQPFEEASGDLEFTLTLGSETAQWTASLAGAKGTQTRTYSPAMAAAELAARVRTGAGVFSHHQRLGISPPPAANNNA